MAEVAVNVPFDSNEIKEIACAEFRKRLDGLGPLQGAKEYMGFDIGFNITISLRRMADASDSKQTLAWGSVKGGEESTGDEKIVSVSTFSSGDPNEERMARHMPMTVETKDGRGGVLRKKVRIEQ